MGYAAKLTAKPGAVEENMAAYSQKESVRQVIDFATSINYAMDDFSNLHVDGLGTRSVSVARDIRAFVFRRGSSEKEQPLRLRKVAGLSPALGSNILQFQSVHVARLQKTTLD